MNPDPGKDATVSKDTIDCEPMDVNAKSVAGQDEVLDWQQMAIVMYLVGLSLERAVEGAATRRLGMQDERRCFLAWYPGERVDRECLQRVESSRPDF